MSLVRQSYSSVLSLSTVQYDEMCVRISQSKLPVYVYIYIQYIVLSMDMDMYILCIYIY